MPQEGNWVEKIVDNLSNRGKRKRIVEFSGSSYVFKAVFNGAPA